MYTFQTPAPIAITVDVLSAAVTVVATDRADTVVRVEPADPAKKADVRTAEQTRVEFSDGTLSVITPKTWRTSAPFGGNPTIEVIIEAPTGSRFAGSAGVGRLLGAGALGDCELEISLGDIVVERPQGSVTAKTSQGDIRIGEAVAGEIRVETSLGALEVGVRPGSAVRLETTTVLGTVRNLLDQIAPATEQGGVVHIYAKATKGDITVGHPATV
ncbi:hypothetical protein ACFVMC_11215 [Nocardia sp. NPDC127579]|uniref:hypothetical protein n=1 Tax=Nocardia sp. NPDC127579 TaxID=3345402 RepID=UPI0036395CFD